MSRRELKWGVVVCLALLSWGRLLGTKFSQVSQCILVNESHCLYHHHLHCDSGSLISVVGQQHVFNLTEAFCASYALNCFPRCCENVTHPGCTLYADNNTLLDLNKCNEQESCDIKVLRELLKCGLEPKPVLTSNWSQVEYTCPLVPTPPTTSTEAQKGTEPSETVNEGTQSPPSNTTGEHGTQGTRGDDPSALPLIIGGAAGGGTTLLLGCVLLVCWRKKRRSDGKRRRSPDGGVAVDNPVYQQGDGAESPGSREDSDSEYDILGARRNLQAQSSTEGVYGHLHQNDDNLYDVTHNPPQSDVICNVYGVAGNVRKNDVIDNTYDVAENLCKDDVVEHFNSDSGSAHSNDA